jgi:2-methylcitrate dehydratase PrpD
MSESDRPRPAKDFDRLGSLVERVLDEAGRRSPDREPWSAAPGATGGGNDVARSIAIAWDKVVGFDIRSNARPTHFRHGRLVVTTSSSAWAQSLQLMSEQIRDALNLALGGDTVSVMIFRHAGWEERGK